METCAEPVKGRLWAETNVQSAGYAADNSTTDAYYFVRQPCDKPMLPKDLEYLFKMVEIKIAHIK
jgi:hypothetical protein